MALKRETMRLKNFVYCESSNNSLLDCLKNKSLGLQIRKQALGDLMKSLKASSDDVNKASDTTAKIHFPVRFFNDIMSGVIHKSLDTALIMKRFQKYLTYDDVRYYAMSYLLNALKKESQDDDSSLNIKNVFAVMKNLSMPEVPLSDEGLDKFLVVTVNVGTSTKFSSYQEQSKMFTWLWMEFLKKPLSRVLLKEVLILLDEVMPHMTNPLQLSDFLVNSYELGGVVSVLALNGLFILISKFNLNMPNFYEKLYVLLNSDILEAKYRARFLYLLDIFLSSTHIPGYLIAAFTKKLSRLSLMASPDALLIVVPLIYNLLVRHPNCQSLVHANSQCSNLSNDPFDDCERDPSKCGALDSSLWEYEALKQHYHHTNATDARKSEQPLSKMEIDISTVLDCDSAELVGREEKKTMKIISTTMIFDSSAEVMQLVSCNNIAVNQCFCVL